MSKIPQADIDWSLGLLATLNTGGVWFVPRSGLMFTKTGEKSMELRELMPDLLELQTADYRCIAGRFRAAGIEVSDKTGLMAKTKGQ